MTPPGRQLCLPLEEKIAFTYKEYPLATVDFLPLSPYSLTLEEIQERAKFQGPLYLESLYSLGIKEVQKPLPPYLDSFAPSACAYRINSPSPVGDFLSPTRLFEKSFLDRIPLYGLPTTLLLTPSASDSSAVYDPERSLFYATTPTEKGLKLYLVGDRNNFSYFARTILETATFLLTKWNENPFFIFSEDNPLYLYETRLPQAPQNEEEADVEIQEFLLWLKGKDPDLFTEVEKRVKYASFYKYASFLEYIFCVDPSAWDAFVDAKQTIYFLPATIQKLKEGRYEEVLEILAHEAAHLKTLQKGLVKPSEELMHHGLTLFIAAAFQNSFWEALFFTFFREQFHTLAQCRLLPLIPEEELYAHQTELGYVALQGMEASTIQTRQEALQFIEDTWKALREELPPGWDFFAARYYGLALTLE